MDEHLMRAVGSSLQRPDALPKVAGAPIYAADLNLPDQLWLKVVFAGLPHARVRDVDVEAARQAPGVVAVFTAADVPVNEYGLNIHDQPVLCGVGSTPQAELVRWEADHIALVVAETPEQAEAAARLVRLEADLLPIVTTIEEAQAPDAPILHPYPFYYPYGERDLATNVLLEYNLIKGDAAAALEAADVVIESTYRTHAQEHAYLQPEAGLARVLPDGRIEVTCPGQWMHEERHQIAHALNLPAEQIVVRHGAVGGAFGGREDMSLQIVLALATWKTGRPVKAVWSREESIVGHHKRHPFVIKARWGATLDGHLVAAEMDLTSDCGAYAYTSTKVLGNALLASLGPYRIPNVSVVGRTVYTNNTPSGAFRGFGGPQAHFAAEMQMNKLAEALDLDPVEFRRRNLWREGDLLHTGSQLPAGVSAREVVEEAARVAWLSTGETALLPRSRPLTSFEAAEAAGGGRIAHGRGFACCFKNVGFSLGYRENCAAWVELHGASEIERAVVACVGADVGQGAHGAFRQIAAEALGIDAARVEVRADSSEVTGNSGSSSASRMTFMAGNAIVGAAQRALAAWQEEERPARADYVYYARQTTGYNRATGESDPNVTYGYCAQVAEVDVDLDTGHITLKRLVSVNDVGRAVNPQQVEGQIEGAVAQSTGWALLEQYVQHEGRAQSTRLSTYLIPSILDVAEVVEPIILEIPDPQGPLGARGMAEMPFIPTAPAIAAAIHDATGLWLDTLPFKPDKVWEALQSR